MLKILCCKCIQLHTVNDKLSLMCIHNDCVEVRYIQSELCRWLINEDVRIYQLSPMDLDKFTTLFFSLSNSIFSVISQCFICKTDLADRNSLNGVILWQIAQYHL